MNECCSSLLWVSYNFRLCYLLHAYEDDVDSVRLHKL
ncbi:hypothetical protein V6Z12_D12G230800 [Gossypium hirsutum]